MTIEEMKVEHDIPVPQGKGTGITAALRKLVNVGDSIFIKGKKSVELSGFISGACLRHKCACRTMDGGVRVWRTKE